MGQQITIDLNNCDDVKCKECESTVFTPLVTAKRIPGIAIGAPEDQPKFMQLMICSKCGTSFEDSWVELINSKEEQSSLIL